MDHKPYKESYRREPDFRVKYRFYTSEEGGRYSPFFQGCQPNSWYLHPDNPKGWDFMISPEFEDEHQQIITAGNVPIESSGTATMWIRSNDFIAFHTGKIVLGTKGLFKEGARKVGEWEVIELINIWAKD